MTVFIDDVLATAFLTTPVREGWIDDASSIQVKAGLSAADVSDGDVALIPVPEATLLTGTHVIDRSVAIVHDGQGMFTMRTPVRPDEIEEADVYLPGVGTPGELLIRSLLKPYFGITANRFLREQSPSDARVVVSEGAEALRHIDGGSREDLVRSWFIMMGKAFVSHVMVVGVRALARDADQQVGWLQSALERGRDQRRDVRRLIREATGIDQDTLAAVTGTMRFALEPDDQEPVRLLIERGTWGTPYGRTLPAYRDQLGTSSTRRPDAEGRDGE